MKATTPEQTDRLIPLGRFRHQAFASRQTKSYTPEAKTEAERCVCPQHAA